MLSAWLLLIIAALIVLCFSLYYHAKRTESEALTREWLATEELRDTEAALRESQQRVQSLQSEPILPAPPPEDLSTLVLRLRRSGKSASRIAQELGLPTSAVETLIALRIR